MTPSTPALVVEDLHKRFGSVEVLKGISLTVPEGAVISILGSSGSGKSTFLRCINLLETPDAGTVTMQGETIRMRTDRHGRRVPADHKSVFENSLTRSCEPFQHQPSHRHLNQIFAGLDFALVILTQAAKPINPGQRPFHDPALGLNDKTRLARNAFDDLYAPVAFGLAPRSKRLPGIALIRPDPGQARLQRREP